ncbi:timeless protein-domain-containing protein [Amylocarpus encephaloides]|uniref:Topoisomerase 1-associated factor 1 n=1 Tax=Amylocarpus encephaloides TaxID=45428 RepID=A0A9P8C7P9_9HELO|nr:timeless protein-domain-containing protein [Amylocarpus encephaloides]
MEFANGKKDVVDPEVRAYVSSLVTALGGSGADEEGRYVLGDDALACLRDLKRWLKLYDEKANRMDVARCLAESNLVGGDLLQILAAWPENENENKLKSKIALACLELLVPLTWPLENDAEEMSVNHHRHMPYLQIAQLGYKRSIVNFDGARIFHTAIRTALPSMAEHMAERSTRDEGIIKLLLYFLRNIAMIAPPPNVRYEGDEAEISRSATIDAFDYQDVFQLLLTLSSSMGEDFNTQDVVVMDVIFHLIKGVDGTKLFMDEKKADDNKTHELMRLRKKEAAMLRSYQMHAPTRHNRFGAMAWIQRDDAKRTTISGQSAVTDSTRGLAKMDSTKKFKPPRRAIKGESGGPLNFDAPVNLSVQATKHLRSFVGEFLDAGFNPLFDHIRKAIDREAERVMGYHPKQFFYLVSWFLEAERARRRCKKPARQKVDDIDSFALVASVLNQEMFVTLNRAMDKTFEEKSWADLSAAMKCFTQILLTVQEMSESPLEDDQEIAENILNRIFYEETTHDRVANITRTYKDQGFGYLDSVTELCHNYLRILENYSKQNADLQVRSRRQIRKKKKAARAAGEDGVDDILDESDADDLVRAEKVTHERKFDFKRFASRFVSQGCVDTFVKFAHYFNDLKPEQLKRAHRFFYRVAFKQEMGVMLFRVDIIALFHKMVKGPESLDPQLACYKEWDEFVKQILKRCFRKMQERPELVVEILFSKLNATAHYLEYGYEKQTVKSTPRAAAALEVKVGMEWEEQIGVVVGALLDNNDGEHVQWVKAQLTSAESERRSWEGANAVVPPVEDDPFAEPSEAPIPSVEKPEPSTIFVKADNDARKVAMFKNGQLRLLMTLIGFKCIGVDVDPEGSWIIPPPISADQLKQSIDEIKKAEFKPPVFDDGKEAADFLKRSSAANPRKKAVFDDDDGIDDDEELMFEPGGPTAMKPSDAIKELKKKRRLRKNERGEDDEENSLTGEQVAVRAEARRQKELEKNRKIKSELYINPDDDEDDDERDNAFFAAEAARQVSKVEMMKLLLGVGQPEESTEKTASKKRRSSAISSDSDDDDAPASRKKQPKETPSGSDEEEVRATSGRSSTTAKDDTLEDSDEEATDTPLSSPHTRPSKAKKQKVGDDEDAPVSTTRSRTKQSSAMVIDDDDSEEDGNPDFSLATSKGGAKGTAMVIDDDEDEEDLPMVKPARPRVRSGFIVDSSDEE